MNVRRRIPLIAVASCLVVVVVMLLVVRTKGQEESYGGEQWEYLAVAGAGNVNFTPTGHPRMRKEPNVPFGREAFVLEQHLDKLGANGWELVAIGGSPNDPAYYFKRRKAQR